MNKNTVEAKIDENVRVKVADSERSQLQAVKLVRLPIRKIDLKILRQGSQRVYVR